MSKPYPEKSAVTKAPLLSAIARRWSAVAFSDLPIEEEKINTLFEAARWTESSRNEQPWRFIYATKKDKQDFAKLASLLKDDNQYAKKAYLLIVICAFPRFVYKSKPNRHWQYDTGAAAHSIFLQAVEMNLIAHEMGGVHREKAHEILDIPEDVEVMAMMAVGYPGDEASLNEKDLAKHHEKRQRKKISEIAAKGKWQFEYFK